MFKRIQDIKDREDLLEEQFMIENNNKVERKVTINPSSENFNQRKNLKRAHTTGYA